MYMSMWKLMYPKPEDIQVVKEDGVRSNDMQEHQYNIKVNDRIILSLTEAELITVVAKSNFALQSKEM